MDFDYLIVGAGISGAALGYELAASGKTLLVDMEAHAGFHSTGRSAALYTPNYGPDLVRQINKLSYSFLNSPPAAFSHTSLLTPRGMMTVANHGCESRLNDLLDSGAAYLQRLSAKQVIDRAPFLRPQNVIAAAYEDGVFDMDVNALHQGFLAGFKANGGICKYKAELLSLTQNPNGWTAVVGQEQISARIVVNAAGAWADKVGAIANATHIGLQAKCRTAMLIDPPPSLDMGKLPAIDILGVENYIKPEAQQLMVSPGDETLVDPCDIQANDLTVATLVDWLERETNIEVSRVNHQWAGLRCFVDDGKPVFGFDPKQPGFFWLAGQGGYGIMMSSALGRAAASLITTEHLPDDFISSGLDIRALGIERFDHT